MALLRKTDLAKRILLHSSFQFRRHYYSSPDSASRGFFQRRAIFQSSLSPTRPLPFLAVPFFEPKWNPTDSLHSVSKMVKLSQLESIKNRLRSTPDSTLPYSEYLRICVDVSRSHTQGIELAKILDDSSNVVVWGDVVFLRPEQLAKSMEMLMWQVAGGPVKREELREMEERKAEIDARATWLVKAELATGLGLFAAQTAYFMRLTFWTLSWDVMEPICFFAATIHFGLAYGFFLRTSTEPTFEGFFKQRFGVKQAKLMKERGFDVEKFEKLRAVFYGPVGGVCRS